MRKALLILSLGFFSFANVAFAYGPPRCVPRCEQRFLDGQCARWGADFCGDGARCSPRCEQRFLDGQCARWGADYCGLDEWP